MLAQVMDIHPSIRCSSPSHLRDSSSISRNSCQHSPPLSLASSTYLVLTQKIHWHDWLRAVAWLLECRCRLVMVVPCPVSSCPVRLACFRHYASLWCRPRVRCRCNGSREDKGDDFETHICYRVARFSVSGLFVVNVMGKSQAKSKNLKRMRGHPRFLNNPAMRHAAVLYALPNYSQAKYAAQYMLMNLPIARAAGWAIGD